MPVRLGSRADDPPFDWDDPSRRGPALRGVRAAYVTFVPDLAVAGVPTIAQAFVDAAVAEGVERLVLLSGRGEDEAQHSERIVQASGLDWTVLRASWFAQNLVVARIGLGRSGKRPARARLGVAYPRDLLRENYFLDAVLAGTVALPVDAVREPFVDADDLADLAVAALTEDGHAGRLYEITGPELLTFGDAVAQITEAAGRQVRFQPVSMSVWTAELARQDVPDEVVAPLCYLFTEVLDGRNERLTDGLQRGLGRRPCSFAEFARAAAVTGVWDAR